MWGLNDGVRKMILTGNGPLPFALGLTTRSGATPVDSASRAASAREGTAAQAPLPAVAAVQRSGGGTGVERVQGAAGIRAVLATGRSTATDTNPEDRHRPLSSPQHREEDPSARLQHRAPPPAPLTSYANIPTEVMAEIQRLRSENAELKAELAARQEQAERPSSPPEVALPKTGAEAEP